MVTALQLTFLICSVKLLRSILLHHHHQWQNMLTNGVPQAEKISLEKMLKSLKCSLKLVLQVLFTAHYKLVL